MSFKCTMKGQILDTRRFNMSESFRFHPIIKINELNRSVYKDSIFHIQRLNPNETRTKQRKYFRKVDLLSAEPQYQ